MESLSTLPPLKPSSALPEKKTRQHCRLSSGRSVHHSASPDTRNHDYSRKENAYKPLPTRKAWPENVPESSQACSSQRKKTTNEFIVTSNPGIPKAQKKKSRPSTPMMLKPALMFLLHKKIVSNRWFFDDRKQLIVSRTGNKCLMPNGSYWAEKPASSLQPYRLFPSLVQQYKDWISNQVCLSHYPSATDRQHNIQPVSETALTSKPPRSPAARPVHAARQKPQSPCISLNSRSKNHGNTSPLEPRQPANSQITHHQPDKPIFSEALPKRNRAHTQPQNTTNLAMEAVEALARNLDTQSEEIAAILSMSKDPAEFINYYMQIHLGGEVSRVKYYFLQSKVEELFETAKGATDIAELAIKQLIPVQLT